jgi:hypothetical protein
MESRLMLADSDPNKLTIENIRDKLNCRFERIAKNESAREEEQALAALASSSRADAANVVNTDIKVETARMTKKEVRVSKDLAFIVERKDTS